jgi:hypothetical protein
MSYVAFSLPQEGTIADRELAMRTIFLISCALAIAAVGFLGWRVFGSPSFSTTNITAAEILAEARKIVPAPDWPPKPSGHTQLAMKSVDYHIKVPHLGSGGYFGAPSISLDDKVITAREPTYELVDATPEEMDDWNKKTKQMSDMYESQVQKKATELSNEQASKKQDELFKYWTNVLSQLLLPAITAIGGILGIIATFLRLSSSRSQV